MPDITIQPSEVMPSVTTSDTKTPVDEILLQDDFADYGKAKLRIDRLIADFNDEIQRTQRNREDRFKELNIDELKQKGILKENQFMIPVRVIDSNIRREQPAFINYIKQSRRILVFKDIGDPGIPTGRLEEEFSRGMTYSGWDIPHFKEVDGSQTHGWDAIEVVFDVSKPLHVALEHIGRQLAEMRTGSLTFDTRDILHDPIDIGLLVLMVFLGEHTGGQGLQAKPGVWVLLGLFAEYNVRAILEIRTAAIPVLN